MITPIQILVMILGQVLVAVAAFRQVAELPALRLLTIYNTVKHDLTTDMNLMTMYEISQCSLAENALRLPGTDVEGELHDEFYVDDRALKALLIQIFYDRAA